MDTHPLMVDEKGRNENDKNNEKGKLLEHVVSSETTSIFLVTPPL